jgi:hypothetical protein
MLRAGHIQEWDSKRRKLMTCSPSYADFRSRANAPMWLDLGHMTRGEHTREVWG